MKIYSLKREQEFTRPVKELFKFFEKPENLEKITPKSVGFNIITPRPIKMHTGAVLDYTIRILGMPIRWTTLITGYNPPYEFSDVSIKGPYSYWHHSHKFVEVEDGTIMYDEVSYALPFGLIGRLVHALFVKRQLKHIFDYRSEVIEEILENRDSREEHLNQGSL